MQPGQSFKRISLKYNVIMTSSFEITTFQHVESFWLPFLVFLLVYHRMAFSLLIFLLVIFLKSYEFCLLDLFCLFIPFVFLVIYDFLSE